MKNTALIVVDYQNDFAEGGTLAVTGARALAPLIQETMRATKNASGLIVATRDWHPTNTVHFENWPIHCVANTYGAKYIDGIDTSFIDIEIYKGFRNSNDGYSGFEGVDKLKTGENEFSRDENSQTLEEILRKSNIDVLKIVGLATDFCVFATAQDAKKLGFDVEVLRSGIAAVNVPNLPSGEDRLKELARMGVKIS